MMRRLAALTLIVLLTLVGSALAPAAAQQTLDYRVRSVSSAIRDGQVVVEFSVINMGSDFPFEQTARLFDGNGAELSSEIVPPLDAGTSINMQLSVPLAQFPAGTLQSFNVAVGLDRLPPQSQIRQFSTIGSTSLFIIDTAVETPEPAPSGGILSGLDLGRFDPRTFDLSNRDNVALLAIIVGVVAVLLWVMWLIVRTLFARPPSFPAWQPPYVITTLMDPNSTNGRRQLWQQHARSDMLPVPCVAGDYQVRKLLISSSGVKLGGWHVTGLRINQYDRYGRVARSQTIATSGVVKALDRAARKSPQLDWDRAQRQVRSSARWLARSLVKKTTKQNAVLPIALDVRFAGMHGEVRILFELFGCDGTSWQEIDHWEPEMRVVNGSIQENFSYALVGQRPEETRRQFQQRLETDLTHLLAAMVQAPPPPPVPPDTQEVQVAAL